MCMELIRLISEQESDRVSDCWVACKPLTEAERYAEIQLWWREVSRFHEAVYCREV